MKIDRYFTCTFPGKVFDQFVWKIRTVQIPIQGPDGTRWESTACSFPEQWSMNACRIFAQKYLRKAGVPQVDLPRVAEEGIPMRYWRSEVPSPSVRLGAETSVRQVVHRMVGCWTYWGLRSKLFLNLEEADTFYDEVAYLLLRQMAAPNSPQWFNTGLHWAYGIEGPAQGHWYCTESGEPVLCENAYERPQPHACFIQAVEDDLVGPDGIMDLWVREARLFKYGSGTGSNFSGLRAKGEPLSGGGTSSGVMSWLQIGDRTAGAIKSGGTTRRAAKMVILDVDHPDVESFIDWKVAEQMKVAALVTGSRVNDHFVRKLTDAALEEGVFDVGESDRLASLWCDAVDLGVPPQLLQRALDVSRSGETLVLERYDTDWQGEAYRTVSGQQANNSVRVSNAFMNAVARREPWPLRNRVDGEICRTVDAKDLWSKIAQSAWSCADPGLQFDDTINDWHTLPKSGRIRGSNPCSEYMHLDDTACNLASLNLVAFDETSVFDRMGYQQAIEMMTMVLEISVSMSSLPSRRIAIGTHQTRTLGLGFANLGALLMRRALPYDSDAGRAVAGVLCSVLTGCAYRRSAEMAGRLGAFPLYEENAQDMLRVVNNHFLAHQGEVARMTGVEVKPWPLTRSDLPSWALDLHHDGTEHWNKALSLGKTYGFRNAQVSVLAPTGTIGLVMDCDTLGVEPDFTLLKQKTLAGGGMMSIANQSVRPALARLGLSFEDQEAVVRHIKGTRTLIGTSVAQDLTDAGVSQSLIDELEREILGAYSFRTIYRPWVERNGLALAFTDAWVNQASKVLTGHGSVEGVSSALLSDEAKAIFDTAVTTGERYISAEGHVRMMAACQSFISGAISKTVNMPASSTIRDVARVYKLAWKLGVKAVALYRDQSKFDQPLQTAVDRPEVLRRVSPDPVEEAARQLVVRYISERRRLPDYRKGGTQKVRINGHKIFLTMGEYEDGMLGEVFLSMSKEGHSFGALLNCFCIAVSMGLQHGVPLEKFVELFTHTRFAPSGMVDGDPHVKITTSIMDWMFRHLALRYLDRADLANVHPEDLRTDTLFREDTSEVPSAPSRVSPAVFMSSQVIDEDGPVAHVGRSIEVRSVRDSPYEAEPCANCGEQRLRSNGAGCLVCEACGTSTGCG